MGALGDFTTRILLMVDGHPLSNSMGAGSGADPAGPIGALERVEVIKGPAGSVYGPSAFYGVVNLVTSTSVGGSEVFAGGEVAERELRGEEAAATWRGAAGPVKVLASADGFNFRGDDWVLPELTQAYGLQSGTAIRHMDFSEAQSGYLHASYQGYDVRSGCGHDYDGLPAMVRPLHGTRSRGSPACWT